MQLFSANATMYRKTIFYSFYPQQSVCNDNPDQIAKLNCFGSRVPTSTPKAKVWIL